MLGSSRSGGSYYHQSDANGRRTKALIGGVAALLIVALFAMPSIIGLGPSSPTTEVAQTGVFASDNWQIMVITDLDKKSKVDDSGKKFKSFLLEGKLRKGGDGRYGVEWGQERTLVSGHNEAGRGMELSELLLYNGALLTVDDRTGIVFEIVRGEGDWNMAPRYIIGEGDGSVDKGMKLEWATVKGGSLVLGSFGKEFTDSSGAVINTNNNWVTFVDVEGRMVKEDWTEKYNKMRKAVGAEFPGYVIHEAGAWSSEMEKWVFLPRRISPDPYDDMLDEKRGSNTIIVMDDAARNTDVRHAGEIVPTHGFSTFKFVPGTGDQVIAALKSEESEEKGTQETFMTVFTLDGEVLMEETRLPGGYKFEGLEFIPIGA